MPAGTDTASQRLAWPDVAKGVSIIGVVLLHVCLAVPQGMDTLAAGINHILDPLRMPLFFLVSGFFSLKLLRYSFLDLLTKRLWFFLVPYTIWVPVELWFKFREYNMFHDTPMPAPAVYLMHLIEARNMAWFLYALALFSFILWATRKLPTWAGIAVAFTPLLLLPWAGDQHMIGKAVMYLPVFILGARLRSFIDAFSRNALQPRQVVVGAGLYVAGFGMQAIFLLAPSGTVEQAMQLLGPLVSPQDLQLVVNMSVHLLMLPAAIIGAVLLAKVPVVSGVLQSLGRNTLPIYLGHPIALTVLYHYNVRADEWNIEIGADNFWSRTSTWLVVTLLISAVGGLLFFYLMKVPVLKWTLAPPRIDRLLSRVEFAANQGTRRATGGHREVVAPNESAQPELPGTSGRR